MLPRVPSERDHEEVGRLLKPPSWQPLPTDSPRAAQASSKHYPSLRAYPFSAQQFANMHMQSFYLCFPILPMLTPMAPGTPGAISA